MTALWLPIIETAELVAVPLASLVGLPGAGLVLVTPLVVVGLVLWRG